MFSFENSERTISFDDRLLSKYNLYICDQDELNLFFHGSLKNRSLPHRSILRTSILTSQGKYSFCFTIYYGKHVRSHRHLCIYITKCTAEIGLPFSSSDLLSLSESVRVRAEFSRLDRPELRLDLIPLPQSRMACSGDIPPSVSESASDPVLRE